MPKENIILSLNIKLERNIVGFKLVFPFVLAFKTQMFWSHTPRFGHARLDVVVWFETPVQK